MQCLIRYYRVRWTDEADKVRFTDPLPTWVDAELSRREIGGRAEVIDYYPVLASSGATTVLPPS